MSTKDFLEKDYYKALGVAKDASGAVITPTNPTWTATGGGSIAATGIFTAGTVPLASEYGS